MQGGWRLVAPIWLVFLVALTQRLPERSVFTFVGCVLRLGYLALFSASKIKGGVSPSSGQAKALLGTWQEARVWLSILASREILAGEGLRYPNKSGMFVGCWGVIHSRLPASSRKDNCIERSSVDHTSARRREKSTGV